MHSSELRGEGFAITVAGRDISHADYFQPVGLTSRLGVYAPHGVDAVGAVNLILAHVTAFYDACRAQGGAFFAYPDYFVVYPAGLPRPDYGMFDIWPHHKVVPAGPTHQDVLRALTDRAVNILLVPDGPTATPACDEVALASARRTITTCYAYAPDGLALHGDVTIAHPTQPLLGWVDAVLGSADADDAMTSRLRPIRETWSGQPLVTQTFRRIDLGAAIALLAAAEPAAVVTPQA